MACRSLCALFILLTPVLSNSLWAQVGMPKQIINGDMETAGSMSRPRGWNAAQLTGTVFRQTDEEVFEGEFSALIESVDSNSPAPFVLNQGLLADDFRGQRVQLRAAVRTSDRVGSARAQLWMRVDRRDGDETDTLAFDNMESRPIRGDDWEYHQITLDVAENATHIALGMFVVGKAKAWLDDVTLTVVDEDTESTDMFGGSGGSRESRRIQQARARQIPPEVMKALGESENAPQQPFWTPWLTLVAVAVGLMLLSERRPKLIQLEPVEADPTETNRSETNRSETNSAETNSADAALDATSEPSTATQQFALGAITKFAFRFTLAYWFFYIFPQPLSSLSSRLGMFLYNSKKAVQDRIVPFVADRVFGTEHELVPPNGSGDTTYNYLWVLLIFVASLLVAVIWTIVDRRTTDYRISKDLSRSFVRYFVAITMLSYGMAKAAFDTNQFPVIEGPRLDQTWGDSSPMGVVWKFMGSSRPYTIFAGLGEIAGGILLMFRRTTLVGAMVTFGVMTNVMMLNYCYDVPVKLLSTHLVIMSLYLMLPDLYGRLGNVLLWNRPTEPIDYRPPYANGKKIWVQRGFKFILLVLILIIPLYKHTRRQYKYLAEFDASESQPDESRLRSRGYRWINEVPFNR